MLENRLDGPSQERVRGRVDVENCSIGNNEKSTMTKLAAFHRY